MYKKKAMRLYREAWVEWLSASMNRKDVLEKRMDNLQPHILPRPGPEWESFIRTLPGYREYWSAVKVQMTGGTVIDA